MYAIRSYYAIDLLSKKAYRYSGQMGMEVEVSDNIPENLMADVEKYRSELIERIVENDDEAMSNYLDGNRITSYNVCYTKLLRVKHYCQYPNIPYWTWNNYERIRKWMRIDLDSR